MTFNLTSETSTEKIYKVENNDMLTAEKVEADADFKKTVGEANYGLEGDMEDPNVMWLTVSL